MSDEGTLIKMKGDFFPYCRGDVVRVTKDELEEMGKRSKARGDGFALYEKYNAATTDPELDETDDQPSHQELRARAKELGIPANGSKEELQARISEKEASLSE